MPAAQPDPFPQPYRQAARLGLSSHLFEQGQATLRVTSNSMAPLMWQGDRILVKQVGLDKLYRGAIVLVEDAQHWTTHRLLAVSSQGLLTKGDRNFLPDVRLPLDAYIGVVAQIDWLRSRGVYQASLETPLWVNLNRWMGWAHYLAFRIILWGCGLRWQVDDVLLPEAESVPAWLKTLAELPTFPPRACLRILVKLATRGEHWNKST